MRFSIYSVYDVKACAYARPLYLRSKEELYAAIYETAKEKSSGFYKHPEDYTVFELGTFDEETAKIEFVGPMSVGSVLEIRTYMARKHMKAMRALRVESIDEDVAEMSEEEQLEFEDMK